MRRRSLHLAPFAFVVLPLACAPPRPSEPESTAVYAEPPPAEPIPITRLSVNEPEGERLGSDGKPASQTPASQTPASGTPTAGTPTAGSPAPAVTPAEPAPAPPATPTK